MNETCPECGHLIRHHLVADEGFDELVLMCPTYLESA